MDGGALWCACARVQSGVGESVTRPLGICKLEPWSCCSFSLCCVVYPEHLHPPACRHQESRCRKYRYTEASDRYRRTKGVIGTQVNAMEGQECVHHWTLSIVSEMACIV